MQRPVALTLRVAVAEAPRLERTRAAFAAPWAQLSELAYRERRLGRRAPAPPSLRRAAPSLPAAGADTTTVQVLHVVTEQLPREEGTRSSPHRFRPDSAAIILNNPLYRFEPKEY